MSEFEDQAAALAYASELVEKLKAAGYNVTLKDETQQSGPVAQDQATGPDVFGAGPGEAEPVLSAWLAAAGAGGKGNKAAKMGVAPAADAGLAAAAPGTDDPASAGGEESGAVQSPDSAPIVVPPPVSVADLTSDDLVTPLTADLWEKSEAAGAAGIPLLMGGSDLEDMQVTVVTYQGAKGERHRVAWCKVRAVAEDKIMAAIAAAQGKQYMIVKKPVNMVGRAPFDQQKDVAGLLVKYAKSINHHVSEGTPIPDHTVSGVTELMEYLEQVAGDPGLSDGERKLLDGYRQDVGELADAIAKGTKTPRKDYGPRKGSFTVMVEDKVPVPVDPAQGVPFTVDVVDGSRVDADESGGVARWNGRSRAKVPGKQIEIDFGDGWKAVYRPHAKEYGVPWGFQGQMEIHAPDGADPTGIADHLNRLYLHGEPMSRAEAEAIYLERNAWAQGLTDSAEYREIQRYVDARVPVLAAEMVMSGEFEPDDAGMAAVIRKAGRQALMEKVGLLRGLFEQRMGLTQGSLVSHPRYKPEPVWETVGTGSGKAAPGGYFVWQRFDVDPKEIKAVFGNRVVGHSLTGDGWENLKKIILGTGILAAQEKRLQMGAKAGSTMSPVQDQSSGGSAYIFLRVGDAGGFHIEWDPEVLLERSDWFYQPYDTFGATNPHDPHWKGKPITDPNKTTKGSSSNEICFKNGIGLFGRYAPRVIRAGKKRKEVLSWFAQAGITHLDGRPVEQVVI